MLQQVVGMSRSVNDVLLFDNELLFSARLLHSTRLRINSRLLFVPRLLFNNGYPAFAFASVRYDLAGEELWMIESVT